MNAFDDKTIMPFGKHKGEKLANVPAGYLIYIYENLQLSEPLKKYIKDNMEALKMEKKRTNQNNYN